MIRLAHFSDIHVTSPTLEWTLGDWFSKRLTSWLNHRYRRAAHFAHAEEIVTRLMADLTVRGIDHFVFSGDATALGFESELRRAADLLRTPLPGLAVPGNHDYCTPKAARSGHFERYFARWQEGRRIGEHRYPFAQKAGPAWLIGVNAATGNRWPWDAAGSVGVEQLARLKSLLADFGAGIKILVIHYPICRSNGEREPAHHGLRDLDALLEIANAGGVCLWLHGHRHSAYHLPTPNGANFPAICAGAATQQHLWSYGEYTIDGSRLTALRRGFDPDTRGFVDVENFTLELSGER